VLKAVALLLPKVSSLDSTLSGTASKPEMTALDLSADIGLLAVLLATANFCLGLLIAVRYSPWRFWPHRRINIFAVHTCTAYLVLTSILIHALLLLFQRSAHWRLVDVAFPMWSPVQPVENTIGATGLYLLFVVVLTSHLRREFGRRQWKAFHYLVYAAGACTFLHGILADPQLQGKAIDPLGWGKAAGRILSRSSSSERGSGSVPTILAKCSEG
jgi:predicted ferric reductase